jgi:hypothetical protein
MATWTFFGKVLPEREPVTWDKPLQGRAKSSALQSSHEFRVIIYNSQAIVDLSIDVAAPVDVFTLANIAKDHVRTITDLIGYERACAFDVEIISAACQETNDWQVFGIEIPALVQGRMSLPRYEMSSDLMKAVGKNVGAQMALADFREAIRIPVGTGFFCYRAIEAISQAIWASEIVDDKKRWQKFRDTLQIDRSAIDAVQRHADFPRHGRPSTISSEERVAVFKLTDEMIKRYLEYLLRGAALSAPEFDVLKV